MHALLFSHLRIWAEVVAWSDRVIAASPRILAAIVVLLAGFTAARIAKSVASKQLAKAASDPRAGKAWGTIVNYVVILLTLVVALAAAGVNLSAMMVAVGAVGFAVAFAMQDTIANFIAGLILLTTHPFAREDAVEIAGEEGTVEKIGMRSTQLRSFDGLRIEVPNRSVINNPITVYSYHPKRRWTVLTGIGYDDDIPGAIETVRDAVGTVDGVLADPAPAIFVDELGGSSVNLKVSFWVEKQPRGAMLAIRSEVTRAVKEALDEGGYDIPYPIRTIMMGDGQEAPNGAGPDGRSEAEVREGPN